MKKTCNFLFIWLIFLSSSFEVFADDDRAKRIIRNSEVIGILKTTPVSVWSYGMERFDDDLSGLQDFIFDKLKEKDESVLVQAFDTWTVENGPSILIRGTVVKYNGRANRSAALANELCEKMLDALSRIPGTFLDDDNDYFRYLWNNSDISPRYQPLTTADIHNLITLKARIGHSGTDELLSCSRRF